MALNGLLIEFHTADPVGLSNIIIYKSVNVISRIRAVSALNDLVENVSSYRSALNVNSAWLHRKIVNETFYQETATTTTIASATSTGDTSIVVADATGFATTNEIKITESSIQEGGIISLVNVVGTTLYLDRPLGNDYTSAATVTKVTTNMAVAGTIASPQIFQIKPPTGTIWQITRILLNITDNLAADDSKFGGIASLTNGVVIEAITEADRIIFFANWKNNGDMKLDMYDVDYTDKAGGGNYGVNGRWTFTKSEVVAELDGNGTPVQALRVYIQDTLSDLLTFKMRAQGRVFSP